MKNSKKGFTLVELLVVIAIVAILATVAVIGYTSFTKKADISNDTVIAKELTTLIQATDINDPVENFDDVMSVLYANGFYLANLNTKTEGCFFVWDSANNQILLVDGKDNFNVIFPESGYSEKGAAWHLICSDRDLLDGLDVTGISVQYAVVSSDSLNELIAAGQDKIYVDEGFVIAEGSGIDFTGKDNVTLVLGESSLSTNGTINGAPIHVENSTLTVEGGTLNASGNFTNEYGTFSCAIGYDGGAKLNVTDVNFIGITGINGAMNRDGEVTLVVENSTFNVTSGGVIMSTGTSTSTATINNCTINANRYALFVSQTGTMTVNGGTYKGGTAVLYCQDAGSKIVVNGGSFDGAITITNGAALEINAGTFVNTGLTLEQFSAFVTDGKTVTEDNGAFIVK